MKNFLIIKPSFISLYEILKFLPHLKSKYCNAKFFLTANKENLDKQELFTIKNSSLFAECILYEGNIFSYLRKIRKIIKENKVHFSIIPYLPNIELHRYAKSILISFLSGIWNSFFFRIGEEKILQMHKLSWKEISKILWNFALYIVKIIEFLLNAFLLSFEILLMGYLLCLIKIRKEKVTKTKHQKNKKIKILFLNHNKYNEGTFFRCYHFARQLVKKNYEITILTRQDSTDKLKTEEFTFDNLRIIKTPNIFREWIPADGIDSIDILYRIYHVLTNKYDLVHAFSHKLNVSLPALIFKTFTKTPVFSDWCDWWTEGGILDEMESKKKIFYPLEKFLETKIRKLYDGVTVISEALKKRCEKLGIPENKILYLWSGCDIENIKPKNKIVARKMLSLPLNLKIITYVGLVTWDIDIIIKAFEKISERRKDVLLLLVGSNLSYCPPETQTIYERLKEKIILIGKQPYSKIPLYLSASDILLLPLRENNINIGRWPNKFGDYLASGRPVITSPVGEIKKFFEINPGVGFLAEATSESFAEKILYLLENPKLAEEYGERARKISEKYSWEVLAEKLEMFYLRKL